MQMTSDDLTNRQLLNAMTQQLGVITDNMATKRDVEEIVDRKTKGFAAKNDLKRFATKDDLKRFATKKEQNRQGVLLEALSDDVKKIAKAVCNEMELKHHSRQIKTLQTAQS